MRLLSKIILAMVACLFSITGNAVIRLKDSKDTLSHQSIGHYWNGKLVEGKALPVQGTGYSLIRLERHNNYGHESLIEFIEELSKEAKEKQLGTVWVGDLSAHRGGRLAKNHRSHQNGLDVDIFFYGEKSLQSASVAGGKSGVNHLWKPAHGELIRLTSEYDKVERIFVNQGIKKHLCKFYKGASWLSKVRTAKGHANHMHVRLTCPADSPKCHPQGEPKGRTC